MVAESLIVQNQKLDQQFSIAFGNGRTVRAVARHLAPLIRTNSQRLPKNFRFHAVSAALDSSAAGSDASAFLSCFDDILPDPPEFDVVHAPAVVSNETQRALIDGTPPLARSQRRLREVNLLITSASAWDDQHSTLRRELESAPKDQDPANSAFYESLRLTKESLVRNGVVGEMLFLPFGSEGPIDQGRNAVRAFSLLELDELPGLIARGTKVILVIGRCLTRGCSKAPLLKLMLNLNGRQRWFTHLVTDAATARSVLANQ